MPHIRRRSRIQRPHAKTSRARKKRIEAVNFDCLHYAIQLNTVLTTTGGFGHGFLVLTSFIKRAVNAKARWLLSRRKLLERLEELGYDSLRRDEQKGAISHPLVVEH